ncbi:hypothetical protein [Pseudomonas sp. ICMP 460]|uniref:hypothetical protein n=1 Tax=Pseudomonas sp. ICMP 460 TaxID=1718917 RepID=UPI000C073B98|nr:hypothetical protein [Pseudomonas sp. ICMP 460]PHN25974.1 hypothetical protein AO240_06710 [Pseudomonas sp. ICMP 460]
MTKPVQNNASWPDTLKTRQSHLNALLKTIGARFGKNSQIQALTIRAIKAEMAHIESQLNRRK